MTLSDLPAVNASLNTTSTIFLILGYIFIRQKKVIPHRNCMIAAFCTSIIFLTCYLIYHFNVPRTVFDKTHWFRPYYLALLLTHTVLAVVIVPMILVTLSRGLKARYELHKKNCALDLATLDVRISDGRFDLFPALPHFSATALTTRVPAG